MRLHTPRQGRRLHGPRPQPRGLPRHRWHPALRPRWHRALRRTLRLRASRHRKSRGRKLQDRKPRKCRHRTSRARPHPPDPDQILRRPSAIRCLRWSIATFNNGSGTFNKSGTFSDSSFVRNANVSRTRPRRQGRTHRVRRLKPTCRRDASNNSIRDNSCELNAPCSAAKTVSCGVFQPRRECNDVKKYGMPVSSAH